MSRKRKKLEISQDEDERRSIAKILCTLNNADNQSTNEKEKDETPSAEASFIDLDMYGGEKAKEKTSHTHEKTEEEELLYMAAKLQQKAAELENQLNEIKEIAERRFYYLQLN